jgi:hypothetical protein
MNGAGSTTRSPSPPKSTSKSCRSCSRRRAGSRTTGGRCRCATRGSGGPGGNSSAPRSNATAAAASSGEHGPGSNRPLPKVPIRTWQVWNEENFFYFARPPSPTAYARLLTVTRSAVHRGDPRADVVLGGLFGNPPQDPPRAWDAADFLDRLYRVQGVKASFDGVALHPYAADTGALRSLVEGVRGVMVRHRDRRAGLYLTELGWGSQYDPRLVSFEVGLRGQARELRSAYRYLIGNRHRLGLRQVDWFTWKDLPGACNFCDSSGLFRRGSRFRPKPAWRAFVSFAR